MFMRIVAAVAFFMGISVASAAAGADSFELVLQRAEAARSSDPKTFEKLLEVLGADSQAASAEQKERLDYLNAYALVFQGRYDQAISKSQNLLASSKNPDVQFRTGALIVNAHALARQFAEGLRQLEETLILAPQVSSDELRHQGYGVAAIIHNQVGQFRTGLHYADLILADKPVGRTLCFANQNRFEALQNLAILPADESPILQAIEQCLAHDEKPAANFIRGTLARKWAAEGAREKAIALLQTHLPEVEASRYPRLIGEIKALLAEMMLERGDAELAQSFATEVVAQSASINSTLPLVQAYKTIYEVARVRGDSEMALSAYRNFAEADKAYINEVKAREMAYQIVRQETLQKNQQINLLDQQNQVLQLQSKLDQKSAQNTRLLVILLVVLMASIGYWAYKIKRVQLSLKKMAQTDALTGLCNRHHFTLQAERSLAQCARADEEASLIMFDLDHFKLINDRYGHQTGDWALKRVGEVCAELCRPVDTLGRLGGEEFAFLMHGGDLRSARRLAEDCRLRIAAIDSRESGHVFVITASFGVASTVASGYSLARLLSQADKMLYRAKHLGRNRVCGTDDEVVASVHGRTSLDSGTVVEEHPDSAVQALAERRVERVAP